MCITTTNKIGTDWMEQEGPSSGWLSVLGSDGVRTEQQNEKKSMHELLELDLSQIFLL